jgi:hypothetical protein
MTIWAIRSAKTQPGDVLLTRSAGLQSTAIAEFSGGRYSHAALLTGGSFTYESDMDTIGFRRLRVLGWEDVGSSPVLLARVPDNPVLANVYRHRKISSRSREQINSALQAEMQESFGKDYSRFYRLINLAQVNIGLRSLVSLIVKSGEEWYWTSKMPGPFCSELVARFFMRLGLPLFDTARHADQITPNHLSNSYLELQSECVVDATAISSFQPLSEQVDNEEPDFSPCGEVMRQAREIDAKIAPLLTRFNETDDLTIELFKKHLKGVDRLRRRHADDIEILLRLIADAVGIRSSQRAHRLVDLYLRVSCDLDGYYCELEKLLTDIAAHQSTSIHRLKKANEVMTRWTEFLANDFSQYYASLVRCKALDICMLSRRLEESANETKRAELRQGRRNVIQSALLAIRSESWK